MHGSEVGLHFCGASSPQIVSEALVTACFSIADEEATSRHVSVRTLEHFCICSLLFSSLDDMIRRIIVRKLYL